MLSILLFVVPLNFFSGHKNLVTRARGLGSRFGLPPCRSSPASNSSSRVKFLTRPFKALVCFSLSNSQTTFPPLSHPPMALARVISAAPGTPASPFLRASVLTHVPLPEHAPPAYLYSSLLQAIPQMSPQNLHWWPTFTSEPSTHTCTLSPFPGLFTSIALITMYFYLLFIAHLP